MMALRLSEDGVSPLLNFRARNRGFDSFGMWQRGYMLPDCSQLFLGGTLSIPFSSHIPDGHPHQMSVNNAAEIPLRRLDTARAQLVEVYRYQVCELFDRFHQSPSRHRSSVSAGEDRINYR